MKLLTPMLVLFVGLSASATNYYDLDPARQAEVRARDAAVYGPGYLTPGNAHQGGGLSPYPPVYHPPVHHPRPPVHHRPPVVRPLPPPPAPGYYDVGPQMTVRWDDHGVERISKLVSETIVVRVGNILTNEVIVRSIENNVSIDSALAYLADGRVVPLTALQGHLREGREFRSLLDYNYSLRVNRIEIRATSGLIGSRAKVQVLVGLAQ